MQESTKITLTAGLKEVIDKWMDGICESAAFDDLGYIPPSLVSNMTHAAILILEASAASSQFTEKEPA